MQTEQFARYYEMLLEWNEKMNLTTLIAPEDVAVKHIIDSLSCYDEKFFPANAAVVDVGTGAGFPGLPLKIWRPDISLFLLDSVAKRLNFLVAVARELGLEIKILHGRAEDAGREKSYREKFDVAVSRAVARLPVLAEYALPLVKTGGYFLAMKGAKYEEELDFGRAAIKKLGGGKPTARQIKLPGLSDVRAIIIVEKLKSTPTNFPRQPGTPAKKPITK